MTFTATGSGTLAYRVVIDGCPIQGVTLPEMAVSTTIGGDRREGLWLRDEKFSLKADIIACKLDVGGLSIKLVDINHQWSDVFDLTPTASTWLAANLTSSGSTVTVGSTNGFPSSGRIWVDSETIEYAGKTSTTFTGCTRGALSPDADAATYHYTTDGVRLRSPEVTNWPVVWEGRRVYIYRYDEGDTLVASDSGGGTLAGGTQVYRGVITTAPRFDGTTWTIGVDSMVTILEQTFGQDLAEPLKPRGIYYPETSPLIITWKQNDADGSNALEASVSITGFYESQEDFCDTVSTALAASMTDHSGSGTWTCVPEGNSGWHLKYKTAASPKECAIFIDSKIDPLLGAKQGAPHPTIPGSMPLAPGDAGRTQLENTDPIAAVYSTPLSANTEYYFYRPSTNGVFEDTALGSVPRGTWSSLGGTDSRTIYCDSATPMPSDMTSIVLTGTDPYTGADYSDIYAVDAVDGATRSIAINPYWNVTRSYVNDDGLPEIRMGLGLQTATPPLTATVADMMDFVAFNQQQYSPLGILPSLRLEDYDTTVWQAAMDGQPPLVTQRLFQTFSPVSLADIIREELKAAGCFLALDSTGRLVPKRIRLPAPSEAATVATIDSTLLLTDKMRASHEVNGLGLINSVTYKDGWDPVGGDFTGNTFTVRDVPAFGRSPQSRPQQIAQHSQYVGAEPITTADVVQIAAPILGTLSGSYAIDTLDAAASQDVQVGDPIIFDDPYLVDSNGSDASGYPAGVLGLTNAVGIVLGREWGAYSPRTTFTVINSRQRLGGYAPSAFVTSTNDHGSDLWTLSVSAGYYPDGANSEDFFPVDYRVQVYKYNATSVASVKGTVTAVSGDDVTVQFAATWTPGADSWVLTFDDSDSDTAEQMDYCSVALSDGLIDSGGDNSQPAKVFAP